MVLRTQIPSIIPNSSRKRKRGSKNSSKEVIARITPSDTANKFYDHKFTDIIGAKLYKIKTIKKIPIDSFHMGFDFQFMSRICKRNYKIDELNIKYKPRMIAKDKKIKFYHMFIALYEIFKVKFFE